MSIPTAHRAVVVVEKGKVTIQEKPLPKFGDDHILVRVRAVALNPTDWKHIDYVLEPGASTGTDYAGDVVAVGKNAEAHGIKVGDAVAGFIRGGFGENKDNGSFQEYVAVLPQTVFRTTGLPYQSAAAIAAVLSTAALAIFGPHQTPFTGIDKPEPFLVWAGSTSVGLCAIKLASLLGYRVVTTASPRNFELVKSLGASAVFDYKDPEAPAKIKAWVAEQGLGPLRKGLDSASEKTSVEGAIKCFADGQGELVTLGDLSSVPSTVTYKFITVYAALEPNDPTHKPVREFYDRLPSLISEEKINKSTIPLYVWPETGLDGVPAAIDYVRAGKHSGEKVVVNVA